VKPGGPRSRWHRNAGESHSPVLVVKWSERSQTRVASKDLQLQAWQWALANRSPDDSLPSGKVIAAQYGRQERWGRLVKRMGIAGELANAA
jgi:hypothetical protein